MIRLSIGVKCRTGALLFPHMIDHMGFPVSDYVKAKEFYTKVLAPLGYVLVMEANEGQTEAGGRAAGFGPKGKPAFWIAEDKTPAKYLHVAFSAPSREAVDAFYAAAIAAGGTDNGAPGLRTQYHPNYYGAFIMDPDGNNVEAVSHGEA